MALPNILLITSNGDTSGELQTWGMEQSGFSDGALITGFISAFRQFGKEMVSGEGEVSNSSWETQPGGSKRLILHTAWGKEASKGAVPGFEVPEVSSILHVSASKNLGENEYGLLEKFLHNVNDEVVYRIMLGEIAPDQNLEPLTSINLLDHVLANIPRKTRTRVLGKTSEDTEQAFKRLLNEEFEDLIKSDLSILSLFLEKVPLLASTNQEIYEQKLQDLGNYVDAHVKKFKEAQAVLEKARRSKIYAPTGNSYQRLKADFDKFQDRRVTYFQNKNALAVSIEGPRQIFNQLRAELKNLTREEPCNALFSLHDDLPEVDDLDGFVERVRLTPVLLDQIAQKINFNEAEIEAFLTGHAVDAGLLAKFSQLKEKLQGMLSLLRQVVQLSREVEDGLMNLQGSFVLLNQEEEMFEESAAIKDDVLQDMQALLENGDGSEGHLEVDPPKGPEESGVRDLLQSTFRDLRDNVVYRTLHGIYERVFHPFGKFKYALVYPGNLEKTIISHAIQAIRRFYRHMQDFGFPALLVDMVSSVVTKDPVKTYSIEFLKNYLAPFLPANLKRNPFLINNKTPVMAIDSYSLSFCAELVKGVGLNEDLYQVLESTTLPRTYKDQFVQVLDSTGLTRKTVTRELLASEPLFERWVGEVNAQIHLFDIKTPLEELEANRTVQSTDELIQSVLEFCASLRVNLKSIRDENRREQAKLRNNFIKKAIFHGLPMDKAIGLYHDKHAIERVVADLEALRDSFLEQGTDEAAGLKEFHQTYFSAEQFRDLLDWFRTLVVNQLLEERAKIEHFLKTFAIFKQDTRGRKANLMVEHLGELKEIFGEDARFRQLEQEIEEFAATDYFESFVTDLEPIDDTYLQLPAFAHVRGILKTVTRDEPLVAKSSVEKATESHDKLLEALIKSYCTIYEDYFGRVEARRNEKTYELVLHPGKYFYYRYRLVAAQLEYHEGLQLLNQFILTVTGDDDKSKYFHLDFLLNYLPAYMKEKGYATGDELIRAFSRRAKFEDFLGRFLPAHLSKIKPALRESLTTYHRAIQAYLQGAGEKPAGRPFDLRGLRSETLLTLDQITVHVKDDDRRFYIDGKGPRGHPSRDYSLKKAEKKLSSMEKELENLEELYADDLKSLRKVFKYTPPAIPSAKSIVEKIKNGLKEKIRDLVGNFGKVEDLRHANIVRIGSLLDAVEYKVPADLKMRLVDEGKLNRANVIGYIMASSKISTLLRENLDSALERAALVRELYKEPIHEIQRDKSHTESYIGLLMKPPAAIRQEHLGTIFGRSAVWLFDKKHQDTKIMLTGHKIPFRGAEKQTFGDALREHTQEKIARELDPVFAFFNQYSKKVHSGFQRIYEKMFLFPGE